MDLFSVLNGILILSALFYGILCAYHSEHKREGKFYFSGMVFFLNAGLLMINLVCNSMGVYDVAGFWIALIGIGFNVVVPFLYMSYKFAKNWN